MDPVKTSFNKVKQDISSLKEEINNLTFQLKETRNQMLDICEIIKDLHKETAELASQQASTYKGLNQTLSTHLTTHHPPFKPLKPQISPISTGNRGVPTDRQTDRQTHRQTQNYPEIPQEIFPQAVPNPSLNQSNTVDNAAEILESLDNIKKEIRLKFKRLTDQEFIIFSTVYQLSEDQGFTDYKTLANKLNLTQSSIRDYIGRIIRKGIPVEKKRINNKTIQLSVSHNLKKITSLQTIMQLRGI